MDNHHVILSLVQDTVDLRQSLVHFDVMEVFPLQKVNVDYFKWGVESMCIETKKQRHNVI